MFGRVQLCQIGDQPNRDTYPYGEFSLVHFFDKILQHTQLGGNSRPDGLTQINVSNYNSGKYLANFTNKKHFIIITCVQGPTS